VWSRAPVNLQKVAHPAKLSAPSHKTTKMSNHKACKSVTEDKNYKLSVQLLDVFYKLMPPTIFHSGATYEALLKLYGEETQS